MAEVTRLADRKPAKCPICGKPPETAYKPFCSQRCTDVDLHRWLGEGYRIPTNETPDSDGTGSDEPKDNG
ncbi:MAG: DNA gyrase inhibitor YacG [Rhodospirillaceae bacterium]|nr:DNA gyrase inhibitor YacG [Rhodospirillaceae bacterium]